MPPWPVPSHLSYIPSECWRSEVYQIWQGKDAKGDAHSNPSWSHCPASVFLRRDRSKGLTEEALGGIGYASTYFFRPGLLYGAQREKARPAEKLYSYFTHYVLSKVSASAEIAVPVLASSIVETAAKGGAFLQTRGVKGSPFPQAKGSATILSNAEALKLGGQ